MFRNSYGEIYFFWIITGMLAALAVVVLLFMLVIRQVSVHYDKAKCHSFASQTNRQTRFVMYNYWSWDCLTPSKDGKWISIDNLRDLTQ